MVKQDHAVVLWTSREPDRGYEGWIAHVEDDERLPAISLGVWETRAQARRHVEAIAAAIRMARGRVEVDTAAHGPMVDVEVLEAALVVTHA